jgi:hypothetical protein
MLALLIFFIFLCTGMTPCCYICVVYIPLCFKTSNSFVSFVFTFSSVYMHTRTHTHTHIHILLLVNLETNTHIPRQCFFYLIQMLYSLLTAKINWNAVRTGLHKSFRLTVIEDKGKVFPVHAMKLWREHGYSSTHSCSRARCMWVVGFRIRPPYPQHTFNKGLRRY